jgi:hypothetical protein
MLSVHVSKTIKMDEVKLVSSCSLAYTLKSGAQARRKLCGAGNRENGVTLTHHNEILLKECIVDGIG